MESRFNSPDTSMHDVGHGPDVSVVHVAQEDMEYRQALHWESTIGTRDGRSQAFEWLMKNDPMIAGLYTQLRRCEVDEDQEHLAAVLILVNAMRSKVR